MHDFRGSGEEDDTSSESGEESVSFDEDSISGSLFESDPKQRADTSESGIQPVFDDDELDEVNSMITLTNQGEWWVAKDIETGVTSQGETRSEALENLDEAVAGYNGEGHEPTDEELREIGIDPEDNVSGEPLPDEFL